MWILAILLTDPGQALPPLGGFPSMIKHDFLWSQFFSDAKDWVQILA